MSRHFPSGRRFAVLFLFSHLISAAQETPRNIIFMIGDGMGFGQLSALLLSDGDAALSRFPFTGFSVTPSLTSLITESAAGGTALSTGRRTADGRIAMDSAGVSLPTLLEHARNRGKATGVLATSAITHATPAAFLAHVPSRKMEYEIAEQIVSSGVDVLIGGGLKFFLPSGKGGNRKDGRNLLEEMANSGYTTPDSIHCPEGGGRLIMLAASEALPAAGSRPYELAGLLRCALSWLSTRDAGFVLMVEGSQIDWAGHSNNFDQMMAEMRDFDGAVAEALDFARSDGNTLLVVTADHETGGLSVIGERPDASDIQGLWNSKNHTAAVVPVLAFGPGAHKFTGVFRIDEIGRTLIEMLAGGGSMPR